jgi:hypothetical protein
MHYDLMIEDSFEYAKEALIGKWVRWIIFIILGLPFALIQFIFDPDKILDKTTGMINWELVHWDQLAMLIAAGIFFSFFLAGYMVRVYQGTKPAPDFNDWVRLFIDGLKLNIVGFLWILPFLGTLLAMFGIIFFSFGNPEGPVVSPLLTLGIFLLLLIVACIFAVIACLYSYLGSIRFARTGSIREGIRFTEITATIRTMGWFSYILGLILLIVIAFIFGIISMILSVIPYIGWVLVMIINPFIIIIFGRYMMLIYEQGEKLPETIVQQ